MYQISLQSDIVWWSKCRRKFWKKQSDLHIENSFENFNNIILKEIPKNLDHYETIIGEDFFVNQFRLSKFIKHNFKKIFFEPSLLYDKNKRSIKFHFDMMHGNGNLDKAIDVLSKKEKNYCVDR